MEICDFSRSFVTWRLDLKAKPPRTLSRKPDWTVNNARVQLECLCTLRGPGDDDAVRFVLGAACKTENVNVERDIWMKPNADFNPVFSNQHFLAIKSWGVAGTHVTLYPPSQGPQPERQVECIEDAFAACDLHIVRTRARPLSTALEIIEAAFQHRVLVARTEFRTSDGFDAALEYPIKSINISDRDGYYQTDTGPVLYPDQPGRCKRPIESLKLSFIASNAPSWAELIINEPMSVAPGFSINHYSRPERIECANSFFEIVAA